MYYINLKRREVMYVRIASKLSNSQFIAYKKKSHCSRQYKSSCNNRNSGTIQRDYHAEQ